MSHIYCDRLKKIIYLLVFTISLNTACISFSPVEVQSPTSQNPLVIASSNTKCDPEKTSEYRQWYILYGLVSFYKATPKELFNNKKPQAVRISLQTDWLDILMTIPLGSVTSISTNRIVVEFCKSDTMVFTNASQKNAWLKKQGKENQEQLQIKQKAVIVKTLQRIQKKPEKERWVFVILNNGNTHIGFLEDVTEKVINLNVQKKSQSLQIKNMQAVQEIKKPNL